MRSRAKQTDENFREECSVIYSTILLLLSLDQHRVLSAFSRLWRPGMLVTLSYCISAARVCSAIVVRSNADSFAISLEHDEHCDWPYCAGAFSFWICRSGAAAPSEGDDDIRARIELHPKARGKGDSASHVK